MRRGFALGLGWVAVTAAAVLVAWRGVDVVADQLTESRPSALSSAAVANALTDEATGVTRGTGGKTSTSTSTTVRRSTASLRPGTTTPTTTTPPATAAPRTTSPPATAATSTLPPPPAGETRTYSLVGGTVGIRYENGGARLLYANPNSGFTVKIGDAGPPRVDVEFESDTHKSRLDARWQDGPRADVDEEDEGGGGGGSGPG